MIAIVLALFLIAALISFVYATYQQTIAARLRISAYESAKTATKTKREARILEVNLTRKIDSLSTELISCRKNK